MAAIALGFTLSLALCVPCDAISQHFLLPYLCHTPRLQRPPDFFPALATCLHPLCMEWRVRYMQGRKADLTKFWKSVSWVRGPSGIYKGFTTHPLIWHFGDYNHPLFILCSRSLWDLNESWRILISNPKNPKWWQQKITIDMNKG